MLLGAFLPAAETGLCGAPLLAPASSGPLAPAGSAFGTPPIPCAKVEGSRQGYMKRYNPKAVTVSPVIVVKAIHNKPITSISHTYMV